MGYNVGTKQLECVLGKPQICYYVVSCITFHISFILSTTAVIFLFHITGELTASFGLFCGASGRHLGEFSGIFIGFRSHCKLKPHFQDIKSITFLYE